MIIGSLFLKHYNSLFCLMLPIPCFQVSYPLFPGLRLFLTIVFRYHLFFLPTSEKSPNATLSLTNSFCSLLLILIDSCSRFSFISKIVTSEIGLLSTARHVPFFCWVVDSRSLLHFRIFCKFLSMALLMICILIRFALSAS